MPFQYHIDSFTLCQLLCCCYFWSSLGRYWAMLVTVLRCPSPWTPSRHIDLCYSLFLAPHEHYQDTLVSVLYSTFPTTWNLSGLFLLSVSGYHGLYIISSVQRHIDLSYHIDLCVIVSFQCHMDRIEPHWSLSYSVLSAPHGPYQTTLISVL